MEPFLCLPRDQEMFLWWVFKKNNFTTRPRDVLVGGGGLGGGGLKKKSSHGLFVLTFHHETKRCSRDGGYFKKISP